MKKFLCVLIALCLISSDAIVFCAEDKTKKSAPLPGRITPLDYDYWYYLAPRPRDLWGETKETFWGWNLAFVAATAGVSGGLAFLDNDMQKPWRRGDEILGHDITKIADVVGHPGVQAGVMGLTYSLGQYLGDEKLARCGKSMAETMIFTALTTIALKGIFHRKRPNGEKELAFPSWHASSTFGNATVLAEYYGWKAAIPSYLVALFVGWSRIEDNKHFVSDVVAGAAIGCIYGHAVSSYSKRKFANFAIEPTMTNKYAGVQATFYY